MPRVTCIYKITGTETFRLASAKLFGHGRNMQNWSKSLRKLIIPDDGKIFVQVDQAGAEALIVAYLCEHGNFRDLFLSGVKSHVFVALRVFQAVWQDKLRHDKTIDFDSILSASPGLVVRCAGWKVVDKLIKESDKWVASERYYYIAKMICHAANYGMRAPAFQLNVLQKSEGKIALSKSEAEAYLETYHTLFPEIQAWHRATEEILKSTRVLRNLQGFPREFTSGWNDNILKEALAFVPQSTVGTITNVAFARMQDHIEICNLNWDLLNNCHDSYLLQVPIGEEQDCATKAKELMEQTLVSPRGEIFKMKSEASIGLNWGQMD